MKLRLKCPCGARMTTDASHAGKSAKCKQCDRRFRIPEPPAKAAPGAAKRDAAKEDDVFAWLTEGQEKEELPGSRDFRRERFAGAPSKPRQTKGDQTAETSPPGSHCPECAAPMASGVTLCLRCGYHTRLRRKLSTIDSRSEGAAKKAVWLVGGVICAALAATTYFTLDIWEGRAFLTFYFICVCMAAISVVFARRTWRELDELQFVAIGVLAVVAGIRLVNALAHENYRVGFLVVGLFLSAVALWVTRSEPAWSSGLPFCDRDGRLKLVPCGLLFAGLILLLWITFFFPGGVFLTGGLAAVVAVIAFLARYGDMVVESALFPHRDRYYHGSHHESPNLFTFGGSCGSSCGSGCGGGGCGGGGCGGCGG